MTNLHIYRFDFLPLVDHSVKIALHNIYKRLFESLVASSCTWLWAIFVLVMLQNYRRFKTKHTNTSWESATNSHCYSPPGFHCKKLFRWKNLCEYCTPVSKFSKLASTMKRIHKHITIPHSLGLQSRLDPHRHLSVVAVCIVLWGGWWNVMELDKS